MTIKAEEITTWSELAELAEEYSTDEWIFRGVDNANHQLLPAIGRSGSRKDISSGKVLPFEEKKELEMLS